MVIDYIQNKSTIKFSYESTLVNMILTYSRARVIADISSNIYTDVLSNHEIANKQLCVKVPFARYISRLPNT